MTYRMLTGHFPFPDKNSKLSANLELESLNISVAAKVFISELLHKDKFERLGSKQNDKKIKEHSFFNGIDWLLLEKRELKPPIKPTVVSFYTIDKVGPVQYTSKVLRY